MRRMSGVTNGVEDGGGNAADEALLLSLMGKGRRAFGKERPRSLVATPVYPRDAGYVWASGFKGTIGEPEPSAAGLSWKCWQE